MATGIGTDGRERRLDGVVGSGRFSPHLATFFFWAACFVRFINFIGAVSSPISDISLGGRVVCGWPSTTAGGAVE
jgi:hypothetical protein